MRLLKRTGNDVSFTDDLADNAIPPYAILSHRWGQDEVTYDDIITNTYKTKAGYKKIAFCITQSARDGIHHFWLDTCCINKPNTTELSEALISMYRWYARAQICYVYLDAEWETSEWWRRGWTLQELIAPSNVEFFVKGRSIGTKKSLEQQISEITRIPVAALRGEEYPVADRRSWQEGRQTYREEDMVYSMLGLLDVSMSVLYGEGRTKAEERLQYELDKVKGGSNFALTFSLAQAPVEAQFVARHEELHEIRHNLLSDGSRKIVVLHGLGGIGKTQLTIAYAKRYRDYYSAVLWLNATDEDTIKQSFVAIAKQITRERPTIRLTNLDLQSDDVIDEVKAWLSLPQNTRWLLVYDNDDDPKLPGNPKGLDIRKYLPDAYQGSVIITTRSSEVRLGHCIRIKKLDITPALEILKNSSGREVDADAEQLAHRLDGLPLAIASAGSFLSQSTFSFKKYLDYFDRSWTRLQKLSPTLTTYDRALYTTWQVSYDQVLQRDELAAHLLQLWAFFDNQDLWYSLVNQHLEDEPEWFTELTEDELAFESSMQTLCDYGFAELNATSYGIHACVHSWVCSFANAGLQQIAIYCISSAILDIDDARGAAQLSRRLNKHAKRAQAYLSKHAGVQVFEAYNNIGYMYMSQSRLHDAQHMFDAATKLLDDPEVGEPQRLLLYGNLGSLCTNQGKFVEAEEMYTKTLDGLRELDHDESTIPTMLNLCHLYRSQMRLTEAETSCRELLVKLDEMGNTSNWKLFVQGMLGLVLIDQGKLREAEEMHLECIPALERQLGEDHERTLMSVMNLGALYLLQSKTKEAGIQFERARTGFIEVLGAQHKQTLIAINNVGKVYTMTDRIPEGEALLLESLAGLEELFGQDDDEILLPLINLSVIYHEAKRTAEAEAAHKRVVAQAQKATGINARFYTHYLTQLGEWHRQQGKEVEAMELLELAYTRLTTDFGPQYYYSCIIALSLGLVYARLKMFDKSEAVLQSSLEGFEQLGDSSTWKSKLNLGVLYATMEDSVKAPQMFLEAMDDRIQDADPVGVLQVCNSITIAWHRLVEEPRFFAHYEGIALKGDVSLIMKQLVEAVYYANGKVGTILQATAYMGHNEALKLLIDNGMDIHADGGIFGPALNCAMDQNHAETVRLLLDLGANVNYKGGYYGSPLATACWAGRMEVVEIVLETADIDIDGADCGTPLQAAADQGHTDIVTLLLDKGANIHGKDSGVCGNPLQAACTKDQLDVVKLMLQRGADINRAGGFHGRALHAAARFRFADLVEYLIAQGADVNSKGGKFSYALVAATVEADNGRVIELLLKAGADTDAADEHWGTPLYNAALGGDEHAVQQLLAAGADVNKEAGEHGFALHIACRQGHNSIVRLLLDAGADVHAQGGVYWSSLQAAAAMEDNDIQVLLDRGVDVNAQGGYYWTALQAAASQGDLRNVKLLLSRGADVNASGGEYGTALNAARVQGFHEVVRALVKAGAEDYKPPATGSVTELPEKTKDKA